jgi:protein-disulfide isomerase
MSSSYHVSVNPLASPVIPQSALKVNDSKGVPIVVQMFGDYECPFTERAWDTVSQLLAKYPGKIKLVWRNLPLAFHPHAVRAAETALEAKAQLGEDGFWKMTRLLLGHQSELEQTNLEQHAESLGMNINALRAAWQSGRYRNAIQTDQAAAKSAGFSGTPAFLVGDVQIIGAQPFDKFSAVIESIMAKEL